MREFQIGRAFKEQSLEEGELEEPSPVCRGLVDTRGKN